MQVSIFTPNVNLPQATEERLNEQIIRLDLELWNASLDIHSQRESPLDWQCCDD